MATFKAAPNLFSGRRDRGVSGSARTAMAIVISPMGTLIPNSQGQEAAASTAAAMVGPIAAEIGDGKRVDADCPAKQSCG